MVYFDTVILTLLCHCVFQYELLFCVAEVIDPAIMVVQSLLQKYPHVEARLFIGKLAISY